VNVARIIAAAKWSCAIALICGTASAQPHAEPEINLINLQPVTEPAQVEEWLRRLVGRFKYDGMVQLGDCAPVPPVAGGPPPPPSHLCQGISGKSDCVAIGTGPGVQCVLNVTWRDIYQVDYENGGVNEMLVSFLDPAMELYGVEPATLTVRRFLVNNKGLAASGRGSIKGNTATFRSPCVNTVVSRFAETCYSIVRIEAKTDARLLYVWLGTQLEPEPEYTYAVMSLRRVKPEEESAPTLKLSPQRRK
jgi:hypothetical protein